MLSKIACNSSFELDLTPVKVGHHGRNSSLCPNLNTDVGSSCLTPFYTWPSWICNVIWWYNFLWWGENSSCGRCTYLISSKKVISCFFTSHTHMDAHSSGHAPPVPLPPPPPVTPLAPPWPQTFWVPPPAAFHNLTITTTGLVDEIPKTKGGYQEEWQGQDPPYSSQ
jgi:hypothetical protein